MRSPRKRALAVSGAALLLLATASPAAADSIGSGTASAFGASLTLTDQTVLPPMAEAEVAAPPFGDDVNEDVLEIPGDPLLFNATLSASAAVHQQSDLPSLLEQPAAQHELAGPYNARAVGQVEELEVLIDAVEPGVPLLEADLIRGEAVAVCQSGQVQYAASSEVFNLVIGGQDPLSGPLNDLIGQISTGLNESPLVDLVDIDVNVVSEDGSSVDALVITLLTPASDPLGLVQVRLGHAEVSGVACGEAPECSDTTDNDGDGVADTDDPDCHTDGDATNPDTYDPNDDSEAGGDAPECSDTTDNDGDGVADIDDPDCHTDGNASNPDSYDPDDDSEASDQQALPFAQPAAAAGDTLPNTGAGIATGLAAVLSLGSLGLFALRRRLG